MSDVSDDARETSAQVAPDLAAKSDVAAEPLALPEGRRVKLGRRGRIFFREVTGPEGAPALLLLHGWVASGGLNWHHVFGPLGEHFRVIAPDLRGHARGIRSWRRFRLEDCADDVAALLDELGIDSAIAAGYSMGGPIAKLLWRRHPSRVAGLVLCATSHRPVRGNKVGRAAFTSAMAVVAGTTRIGQLATGIPSALRRPLIDLIDRQPPTLRPAWAVAEVGRHDPRMLMEAGLALGRYSAEDWFRTIDVPTSIVVTTRDRAILPEDQMQLALQIPGAKVYCIDLGHGACADPSFADGLVTACRDVAVRAEAGQLPARRARVRGWVMERVDALLR
ncbi:MAG: alpha/beta hydrolase [Myxococcota bacterium]|nr:alpha/beta hydrolase [Myxococcota bacterium]